MTSEWKGVAMESALRRRPFGGVVGVVIFFFVFVLFLKDRMEDGGEREREAGLP